MPTWAWVVTGVGSALLLLYGLFFGGFLVIVNRAFRAEDRRYR